MEPQGLACLLGVGVKRGLAFGRWFLCLAKPDPLSEATCNASAAEPKMMTLSQGMALRSLADPDSDSDSESDACPRAAANPDRQASGSYQSPGSRGHHVRERGWSADRE